MELSPGELMECVVSIASAGTQGEMPHSKPPFWTTLFAGVGTQVEADEEVANDAGEEFEVDFEDARADTVVTADDGSVEAVEESGVKDVEDSSVEDVDVGESSVEGVDDEE